MHELGLCEGIVQAAARRAGDRQVRSLRVRVGGHPVDPGVIEQGIQVAALGTVVEGAAVDLVLEPLMARCRECGHAAPIRNAMAMTACTDCGGLDVELAGSEQVILESISVATPGSSVDAPVGEKAVSAG